MGAVYHALLGLVVPPYVSVNCNVKVVDIYATSPLTNLTTAPHYLRLIPKAHLK